MKFAILQSGKCVNVIAADGGFNASNVVSIPDGYWIGDYYDGEWHHEKPMTETEILQAQVADLQNQILTMRLGGY